jgi:DNA-directed RNA polymerase subunit RPC12/RpoP
MNTRSLTVPLTGFGCAPTEATLVVALLTLRERVARSARVVGAGLIAALVALPIPVVHFVFVPGAVLTGLTLGILRVQQREIFESAEAACPYCGTAQRLGLAGRAFRLPRVVHCHNCGRQLDLGLDPR